MKYSKRSLACGAIALVWSLTLSPPVRAFFDITTLIDDGSTYVQDLFSQSFTLFGKPVEDVFDDLYTQQTGLTLEDPYAMRQRLVEEGEAFVASFFGESTLEATPPLVDRIDTANATEREMARIYASSVIGDTGRDIIQQKQQTTTAALEAITDLSQQAAAAPSTQVAIKLLAQQSAVTAGLIADLRLEQMDTRAAQQYNTLNTASLSETIDYDRQLAMQERRQLAALMQSAAEQSTLF